MSGATLTFLSLTKKRLCTRLRHLDIETRCQYLITVKREPVLVKGEQVFLAFKYWLESARTQFARHGIQVHGQVRQQVMFVVVFVNVHQFVECLGHFHFNARKAPPFKPWPSALIGRYLIKEMIGCLCYLKPSARASMVRATRSKDSQNEIPIEKAFTFTFLGKSKWPLISYSHLLALGWSARHCF